MLAGLHYFQSEFVMNHRSIFDRFFGACFGFFMACVLIYIGVQLLRSVLVWLVIGAAVIGLVGFTSLVIRARNEHW